jgi:hypothetical protein
MSEDVLALRAVGDDPERFARVNGPRSQAARPNGAIRYQPRTLPRHVMSSASIDPRILRTAK